MKTLYKLSPYLMAIVFVLICKFSLEASSHREAPLIANDPLADNVDLYAFRSPDNPNTITIIATYVPLQLPHGGPNYYTFGENVRYEIHVDNDAATPGDDIIYRFSFNIVNEDPGTFFNIRLGKQNQKATYTLERSVDGGQSFQTIVSNGIVPPNNIGPRSIESAVGLNSSYRDLMNGAITQASTGETVFAGPVDDPFFVDLGGIFDLGDAPRQSGEPRDGIACYNVSAIAIQVPISTLLKSGAPDQPSSILDSDYVIGVWASASRPAMRTLSKSDDPQYSGDWVQVSRLGMPLTNEAVIPVGQKDFWNSLSPYDEITETTLDEYFYNPELALYMDDSQFGGAVPALAPLRIQSASLGAFDFRNGASGLFGLKGNPALDGTALDDDVFGTLLLPADGKPRSVDLWPAFHTGVPNVRPYQLATGKAGDPLAAGKPFVNNFLPNGGDMLRLNMAVPPTPRDDANFSSLGLIQAAAIGLTVAPFNQTADLEFLPNMDGFPNGRRLEDDVTRIELQAVSGVVLAAIGLWYDDYDPANSSSPVTQELLNVLSYTTGVEENDLAFQSSFPYLAMPHSGTGPCSGELQFSEQEAIEDADTRVFVSSNTTGKIGLYSYTDGGPSSASSFDVEAQDADGVYYDKENDALYQLNRTDNRVDLYENVLANLQIGIAPDYISSSTSDFSNGRELTVSGNTLVVAQDASPANGDENKLVIYTLSPGAVTFQSSVDVDINLWGIQLVGDDLYAIIDNSSELAIFRNFLNQSAAMLSPDEIISIEGIVRTHGLFYDAVNDIMLLTDVGSGAVADDGAFVMVGNWSSNSSDGIIDITEQTRVAGSQSQLGNPVDISYDHSTGSILIAERANAGGRYLVFDVPSGSGDVAPRINEFFEGASAIYLADCREQQEAAVSIAYYSLDDCESFLFNSSNFDYSEFVPAYPESLECASVEATMLFRQNASSNPHSCTPGVNGSKAMCVGSLDDCTYAPGNTKSVVFELVVEPESGMNTVIESISFFEKSPAEFDWIQGPSGLNNYPTLYGFRVLKNGTEIFRSEDNATTQDWTLESFEFSNDAFQVNDRSVFRFEFLAYCLVGNGAPVNAWDLDEINVFGRCESSNKVAIRGQAVTRFGEPLENIELRLESKQDNYPKTVFTDTEGMFSFEENLLGEDYSLFASKDDDPLNGISTMDIIMIQRHILGIERFESPYQKIAADANFSDDITALDLIELRKLILGISDNFKNGKTWTFANPNDPMMSADPQLTDNNYDIFGLSTDNNDAELIGIKVGDVNSDFRLTSNKSSRSESNFTLNLFLDDLELEANKVYRLDVRAGNASNLYGFQFSIDTDDLRLLDVVPGKLDLGKQNYNALDKGLYTFSWNSMNPVNADEDEILFSIEVMSRTASHVSDMLDINSRHTKAEAYYDLTSDAYGVTLEFNREVVNVYRNRLYQNNPNPFTSETEIRFELESAGTVNLKIYDISGKLVKQTSGYFNQGLGTITVSRQDLGNQEGLYIYRLETEKFSETRRMSMIR